MVRFLFAAMVLVAACSALPQEPPPPPPPAGAGPVPPGGPAPPPPPPPPAPPAGPAGAAAPAQGAGEEASITSSNSVINPDGSFNYSYELSNGIKAEQSGYLKPGNSSSGPQARLGAEGGADDEGSGDEVQVVTGSFSYVAPDGKTISVRYTADESGYHPMVDYGGQGGQAGQAGQSGQPAQ
ncbi:pupal cuticle protein 20-like [Schistocerca serialis cubense]|uniref:pupal cuticle protein 20-like n=1 Tax=Schistocerca serialis cubense TaxID=2023355 RepID=UPI00214F174B|nr:pupal cuticle protein 20-like [Schistocerca serialis cubense]